MKAQAQIQYFYPKSYKNLTVCFTSLNKRFFFSAFFCSVFSVP